MTCPTCGAAVALVFDSVCEHCAEGERAEWIERLQPDGS